MSRPSRWALLAALLLGHAAPANAQDLCAYRDLQGRFHVFDDGTKRLLEHQGVQEFWVGGNTVLYRDNQGQIIAYHQGITLELGQQQGPIFATDGLCLVQHFDILTLLDKGRESVLSYQAGAFALSEDMALLIDRRKNALLAYHQGDQHLLETDLMAPEALVLKTAQSTAAYLDQQGYLKVFDGEQTERLAEADPRLRFEVGLNTVAYWEPAYARFMVWHRGYLTELDNFEPQAFHAGDNQVAFLNALGELVVFWEGETFRLEDFPPGQLTVRDQIVAYERQGRLIAFWTGQQFEVAPQWPETLQTDEPGILFKDALGLHWFRDGQTVVVTRERVDEFELLGNTVRFSIRGQHHVFHDGKLYSN